MLDAHDFMYPLELSQDIFFQLLDHATTRKNIFSTTPATIFRAMNSSRKR